MASEEERAAIMAEYLAGNDDDGEEEPDFDPTDEDPDESDAYEESDGGNEKDEQPENFAVLDGEVTLNGEGRVVYSGTWSMNLELASAAVAAKADNKDGKEEKKDEEEGDEDKVDGDKKEGGNKKKKTKFKLKSKQIMSSSGGGPVFDVENPTVSKKKDPQTVPPKRTMLFDGFFFTSEAEGHKKIKERDVEITFAVVENAGDAGEETKANEKRFQVEGKGCNEFGTFGISGVYKVDTASTAGDSAAAAAASLVCNKKYAPVASEKRRSHGEGDDDDEEDDDEMSDAADADYGELAALNEEAHMSVEELRKRYYGGHADDNVEIAPPAAKKAKTRPDDSDDDGCGF